MRPLGHAFAGGALIGCLAVATGCGQGGPTAPPPSVSMSVTAPTDGAVISARRLLVLGTVDPPGANVSIAGTPVLVANGAFRHWVPVGWGMRRIRVEATAPGYLPTATSVAVRNEPFHVITVTRRGRRGNHAAPPPLFVRQANSACAGADAANLGSTWSEAAKLTSSRGQPGVVQRLITTSERLVARLRRVAVPPANAAGYAAFLDSYQATINGMAGLLADAQTHAPSKLSSDISALALTFRTAEQRGYGLGLQVCTTGRSSY